MHEGYLVEKLALNLDWINTWGICHSRHDWTSDLAILADQTEESFKHVDGKRSDFV